ncbi:hypothetical protein [Vogesella indigofera]|uniref:hypothetical protein n=1 Tax=Vogesella indigofera TaxID=45465 RepID=UPI0035711068
MVDGFQLGDQRAGVLLLVHGKALQPFQLLRLGGVGLARGVALGFCGQQLTLQPVVVILELPDGAGPLPQQQAGNERRAEAQHGGGCHAANLS